MSLLIHSQPLLVLPELAVRIGLNEAIILQQIHYWQSRSAHHHDGRVWVYNSAVDWQQQFPFWSVNTIRRALAELRQQDLVFTGSYNRDPRDKTLWYSVNYSHAALIPSDSPFTQNGQMEAPNMGTPSTQDGHTQKPNMGKPLPETTTETTSEKKPPVASCDATSGYSDEFEECWKTYPKRHRPDNKKSAHKKWQARINEGVKAETLLKSAKRYADECEQEGIAGTRYVKLAATFFGPDEHWLEYAGTAKVHRLSEHRLRQVEDVVIHGTATRGRPIPAECEQPDDDGILTLPDGRQCHINDWDAGTVTWEAQA